MTWKDGEREESTSYKVLVNREEQYALWPADKETPAGWQDAGRAGDKEACLAYIREVWTDMRPLSLRKKMEETAQVPPPPAPRADEPEPPGLVERLSEGSHPVEVDLRPEKTPVLLRQAIARDYVSIRFTATRGAAEFGFKLDQGACDFSGADFDGGTGSVHLEGGLTVDYSPVRCVADIDLQSLRGSGRLVRV
jgi:uncharacterized protein YbdZ (MbtH family)